MLKEKYINSIGDYAPDFELPGVQGQVHHLARYLEQYQVIGVIFMDNQCSYVQHYIGRLKQIQTDFKSQGVTLIGINANDSEQVPENGFEEMKVFAQEYQLNFPYLRDPNQDVARCFGAIMTPQAFLIDRQGILRYAGAIDDNPQSADLVQNSYLRDGITTLLAGKEILNPTQEVVGCTLLWRKVS